MQLKSSGSIKNDVSSSRHHRALAKCALAKCGLLQVGCFEALQRFFSRSEELLLHTQDPCTRGKKYSRTTKIGHGTVNVPNCSPRTFHQNRTVFSYIAHGFLQHAFSALLMSLFLCHLIYLNLTITCVRKILSCVVHNNFSTTMNCF